MNIAADPRSVGERRGGGGMQGGHRGMIERIEWRRGSDSLRLLSKYKGLLS